MNFDHFNYSFTLFYNDSQMYVIFEKIIKIMKIHSFSNVNCRK